MSGIVARNLVYDYPGTRALNDVSFEIEKGTVTALVGPNGAGKTTLLRCLAALDRPVSGNVVVDGLDVGEHPRTCHRRLGYLSDFFGLYDDLTVARCLAYRAAIHDIAEDRRAAAVERAAERTDLIRFLGRRAGQLSRGERQRLAVAQAIIHDPTVLLLDEPASGLDPEARWNLSQLILRMAKEGMTLVVSSHILTELSDYSTHVMILRHGRLAMHRPIADVAIASGAPAGRRMTSVRIDLASAVNGFEATLARFEGAERITVNGTAATAFLPDDPAFRVGLLRHCILSGLPVVSFAEDRDRVRDIYLALAQSGDGASAGRTEAT